MLGRKQSLKGDLILADYGPEESLNENADIEWVNKVSFSTDFNTSISKMLTGFPGNIDHFCLFFHQFLAMGSTDNANVCLAIAGLSISQHTENI